MLRNRTALISRVTAIIRNQISIWSFQTFKIMKNARFTPKINYNYQQNRYHITETIKIPNGYYQGFIEITPGNKTPILFAFEKHPKLQVRASITMDGCKFPVESITCSRTNFSLQVKAPLMFGFTGNYSPEDQIFEGEFLQGNTAFPVKLTHISPDEIIKPKRIQEPKAPFPYETHEVEFSHVQDYENFGKIEVLLTGTLSIPKTKNKKFPTVVLVSGAGVHNRNEEINGHKYFLVLADYLTRNGVAVLRYDDRSLPKSPIRYLESKKTVPPDYIGGIGSCTTFDFVKDLACAVNYLKTSKYSSLFSEIGVIGHSDGGNVASIAAAENEMAKDLINFIILLGSSALPGDQTFAQQFQRVFRAYGMDESLLLEYYAVYCDCIEFSKSIPWTNYGKPADVDKINAITLAIQNRYAEFARKLTDQQKIELNFSPNPNEFLASVGQQTKIFSSVWFSNVLRLDPENYLSKVKCNVYALYGSKDLQRDPAENATRLKAILQKNSNKPHHEISILENLNHLLQKCKTGAPSEYFEIQETINPSALHQIQSWITSHSKRNSKK